MDSHLCVECGRNFRSSKALHGHLRCHPDRNYRGVHPRSAPRRPPPYRRPPALLPRWMPPLPMNFVGHNRRYPDLGFDEAVSSSSTSSSAAQEPLQVNPPPRLHISNQMSPIPTPIKNPKIPFENYVGRHPSDQTIFSSSHNLSLRSCFQHQSDSEADEPDYTSSLNATESDESDTSSSSPAMQDPLQALPPPLLRLMPPDSYIERNPLSLLATLATDSAPDENITVSSSSSSLTMRESLRDRHEKNRKMDELIVGGTDNVQSKGDYKCSACFKCFGSYQALGGHMTSHLLKSKGNTGSGGKPSGHPCKICCEIYPTGQALGGHMRKHSLVPDISESQPENKPQGFTLMGTWIPFEPKLKIQH